MTDRDGLNRSREERWASPNDSYEKKEGTKLLGAVLIGVGVTAAIYACKLRRLLRSADQFCGFSEQINRTHSSWKGEARGSFRKAFKEDAWRKYEEEMEQAAQRFRQSADHWIRDISQQPSWKWGASYSFGKASQEEAWSRYQHRMREAYEEEMDRLERIRRMQSVFNRERNKYKRSYESWTDTGPGTYHQHSQREDWYWKADTSFRNQRTNNGEKTRSKPNYTLSHHYAALGLNRSPAKPYTEAEIKSAFRAKAKQFHPDQNQENKEAAEAKFKEVLISYEAIKSERKIT